jgi:hypothetical protein
MQRPENGLTSGDARTLSFASFRIDAGLLDRLLGYQRALVQGLEADRSPAAMASAHQAALARSGLSQDVVERALAVLRRFAGNREVAGRLRARAEAVPPDRGDDLHHRLDALEHELRERDDPDTIALLLSHQDEVLALHRDLLRLLGS